MIVRPDMVEYFRTFFDYDYKTGTLCWRDAAVVAPERRNQIATKKYHDYLSVNMAGRNHAAHRIIWILHYGVMPFGPIRHINGDKTDNRIENLKLGRSGQELHVIQYPHIHILNSEISDRAYAPFRGQRADPGW